MRQHGAAQRPHLFHLHRLGPRLALDHRHGRIQAGLVQRGVNAAVRAVRHGLHGKPHLLVVLHAQQLEPLPLKRLDGLQRPALGRGGFCRRGGLRGRGGVACGVRRIRRVGCVAARGVAGAQVTVHDFKQFIEIVGGVFQERCDHLLRHKVLCRAELVFTFVHITAGTGAVKSLLRLVTAIG